MAFFGNSSTVTSTGWKQGDIKLFHAKQECRAALGEYATEEEMQQCINNKLAGVPTKTYPQLIEAQKKAPEGASAGSKEEWSNAWKTMQVDQMKKNIPLEDKTDPTPLLIDKISSLPADSNRRRSAENIKGTLDGTASNVGDGLDNLTRESYKELKRLARQSEMVYEAVANRSTLPSSSSILNIDLTSLVSGAISGNLPTGKQILGSVLGNISPEIGQVIGTEDGKSVSNLQHWKPFFANALRPISDAIGSHSDMSHCIIKNAGGSDSLVPSCVASLLDKTTNFLVDEIEGIFKSHQMQTLANLPSKIAGSLRQLCTALDPILSFAFELLSDIYNGLAELINEIADLIDMVMNKIQEWLMQLAGLIDDNFPLDELESELGDVLDLAGDLSDIFGMFGGFPALEKISGILSIVSGGFASILTNAPYLYSLFKSKTSTKTTVNKYDCLTEIFELPITIFPKPPRFTKVLSVLGGVIGNYGSLGGGVSAIGQGIGNLGSMLSGRLPTDIGFNIQNTRDFSGLLAELLPAVIGGVLHYLLHKLCKIGTVGDLGYSAGSLFDTIRDNCFSKAMSQYATHHSIIAPLFGKEAIPRGSYHAESALGWFENSIFVSGAQTTKGVAAIGPGGSITYKPFGLTQGTYSIGY